MKDILFTLIGIVVTGMVVLLCLFLCYLSNKSDEYWKEVRRKLDKNGRR